MRKLAQHVGCALVYFEMNMGTCSDCLCHRQLAAIIANGAWQKATDKSDIDVGNSR